MDLSQGRNGSTRIAMREDGTLYWLLSDHLGSTSVTATQNGEIFSELRYSAFGEFRFAVNNTPTDYLYTGQRVDNYINLYWYNSRWYDHELSHFVQADSIVPGAGNALSYNRYAYVNYSPVTFKDPSGHIRTRDDASPPRNPSTNAVPQNPVEGAPEENQPPDPGNTPIIDLLTDTIPMFSFIWNLENESTHQALSLLENWFFETGPESQYFYISDPLTVDIVYDPGMTEFRENWANLGYPLPYSWAHTADQREGPLAGRLLSGGWSYLEGNFQLGLSVLGLGSRNPEGRIDAVGGVIGSLDKITVSAAGEGRVKFVVENRMGWSSGTRIPGTTISLINDRRRRDSFFGGTIYQTFIWFEQMP